MTNNYRNNNQIAKNTLILYVRMFLTILMSFYTSRMVLEALGVEDFGIYNVVGGVVLVLGFLNSTLSTASSRYITVALGKESPQKCREVFSMIIIVNLLLSLVVVVLSETIGLWFLVEKIVIPEDRVDIAFWVYQISVATTILNIISVPYNAAIIAHERIKAFAYIGLFEVFAKMGIAFFLTIVSNVDKLLLYAILLFIIQLVIRIIYSNYCLRNFDETKFLFYWNKPLFKEMYYFISWSAYGSLVDVSCTHGVNILLNLFFGPSVNAARGVAVQVQRAVLSFTTSFQTAINPQIIKSVAKHDSDESIKLLIASSKYSFFLLCIIGVPAICFAPFLLNIWLKTIPEHSESFIRLMLVFCIIESLANPLRIVNQADGNIKKFQLFECSCLLLTVPFSYSVLKMGASPESVFVIYVIMEILAHFIRIIIVLPKIQMSILSYLKEVYFKVMPVLIIPLLIYFMIMDNNCSLSFLTLGRMFMLEMFVLLLVFFIGMRKFERVYLCQFLKKKIVFIHF